MSSEDPRVAWRDRRDDLDGFDTLLARCERLRLHGLSFDDLRQLGRSYRLHAAQLARQRARDDDPAAIRHLNALCVRAYTLLYAVAPPPRRSQPRRTALAHVVAQTWPALALSWSLLLGGMCVGGALVWRDPAAVSAFIPASMGYGADRLDRLMASPVVRAAFLERVATPLSRNAFLGSLLFINNTRVGLLSLATGMLGGIPTVLLQLYNGILLGAFVSIFLHDPWPVSFLAWILPHGIPELTAISLCAAGGLLLGKAVALPGRYGRGAALRAVMNPVLLLFSSALPLFAIAALIESFVRESALGTPVRLGIAALLATALIATLLATRRLARRLDVDTGWLREGLGG